MVGPVMIMATKVLATTPTNAIDVTVVDSILEVTKTILGMFTVFPLNVFLTAALITIGVGIFSQLKNS